MARELIDSDPDPVRQFNDRLSGWGTRDDGGLPLGDVLGHSLNRLTICYGVLEAVKVASEFDLVPDNANFAPVGAVIQDRRGSRAYPAAHLSPCSLRVENPNAPATRPVLADVFADGIDRSFVARLFAETELVHRLTNYADSVCEKTKTAGGMAAALSQGCAIVARDRHASPRDVLFGRLIPEFQAIAGREIVTVERTLPAEYEPSSILDANGRPYDERADDGPSRLVDQHGRRYAERPSDVRIHSPSPQAYRANRETVLQILGAYQASHAPKMGAIERMANQMKGVRANEERQAIDRMRRR